MGTCDTCVGQKRNVIREVGHLVKMSTISILLPLKKNQIFCVGTNSLHTSVPVLIHHQEWSLTRSKSCSKEICLLPKILAFRSFQMSQMQAIPIVWIQARIPFPKTWAPSNWSVWPPISPDWTMQIPNQWRTICQRLS